MKVSRLAASALFGLLALAATACQQGEGQRCQINDDCESGLICTNQGVCGTSNTGNADAGPTPDARPLADAAAADATVVTPDAALADATLPDAS
jgi:hypothetical protein